MAFSLTGENPQDHIWISTGNNSVNNREIMEKEVNYIHSVGDTSNKRQEVMLVHTARKADDKIIIIMLL